MGLVMYLFKLGYIALLLISSAALAQDHYQEFVAVTTAYQNLSGSYQQVNYEQNVKNVSETAIGKFILVRPNKLFWHTIQPSEQQIISDGSKLWIYDIELEQVTITSAQQLTNFIILQLFFNNIAYIKQHFELTVENINEHKTFTFFPKIHESEYVSISISFKRLILTGFNIVHANGLASQIAINDLVVNSSVVNMQQFQPEFAAAELDIIDHTKSI